MPVSIRTRTRVLRKRVESANVVAKLAGSDPQLKHEYIVLSAHIDHLGVGDPVNGDRIYNGAIDNASGVAALLDIADQLKRERVRRAFCVVRPVYRREQGMLGPGASPRIRRWT
jgi:Zn-dependent M28 family amino/carboxypeptidase